MYTTLQLFDVYFDIVYVWNVIKICKIILLHDFLCLKLIPIFQYSNIPLSISILGFDVAMAFHISHHSRWSMAFHMSRCPLRHQLWPCWEGWSGQWCTQTSTAHHKQQLVTNLYHLTINCKRLKGLGMPSILYRWWSQEKTPCQAVTFFGESMRIYKKPTWGRCHKSR